MREGIQVIWGGKYGPQEIGTLYPNLNGYHETHAFAYCEDWLESPDFFDLDPYLEQHEGEQFTPPSLQLFGALRDTIPDRFGRMLLDRAEALAAQVEQRSIRTLKEVSYLLAVEDETRMGALRFSRDEGSFLGASTFPIPSEKDLRELAGICHGIDTPNSEQEPEYASRLSRLVSASASLGGARPKATFVASNGELWIAKFPASTDEYDVGRWEFLLNRLACEAGIRVPKATMKKLDDAHSTFCVLRFDRGNHRLMYSSAMARLGEQDGDEEASYLDIADFINTHVSSEQVQDELEQLFRRMVFNVLTGNRDDHLRNHGFLRVGNEWLLSPAFDMNPNVSRKSHALRIDDKSSEPGMETVMATCKVYHLSRMKAGAILDEVARVVATWRDEALKFRFPRHEIQMMKEAFMRVL